MGWGLSRAMAVVIDQQCNQCILRAQQPVAAPVRCAAPLPRTLFLARRATELP